MKVAIYGAGAMGTVLGAYISKAGKNIDLITRNQEHVSFLKESGAHIVGSVDFIQPVTALLPQDMKDKYDLVFLMTKQSKNTEIVTYLKDFLTEDGVICTMQNGLPEPSVASVIGADKTYGCAVAWGATFIGSGVSKLTSDTNSLTFSLGSYGKKDEERLNLICDYLSCMGRVEITDNLIGARWAKLTINSAFSGLSTISGLTFGQVATDKIGKKLAVGVINECISVAQKADIKPEKIQGHDLVKLLGSKSLFKRKIAEFLLPIAMKRHKDLVSGMLQALKRGQKCEIDYVNGVISAYGKKYGVNTPLSDEICKITHEIEEGKRSISVENFNKLVELL